MATDRDDEVARRYRALAREEPPAQLDAAILAAGRRAVGARPGGVRRWGPPLSIAAVLVLATGVVLRMQSEQPGIETSAPATIAPPQPAPVPAQAITHPTESATPRPPAEARARTFAPERKRVVGPKPEPQPFARQTAPMAAQAPPPPAIATPPTAAPAAAAVATTPAPAASAAPAAPAASAAAGAGANVMRDARRDEATAKRAQVPMDAALEKSAVPQTPEGALDRIARLRAEHRDDEADRALEAFRRDFPAYRITEAQWERVRPRTP